MFGAMTHISECRRSKGNRWVTPWTVLPGNLRLKLRVQSLNVVKSRNNLSDRPVEGLLRCFTSWCLCRPSRKQGFGAIKYVTLKNLSKMNKCAKQQEKHLNQAWTPSGCGFIHYTSVSMFRYGIPYFLQTSLTNLKGCCDVRWTRWGMYDGGIISLWELQCNHRQLNVCSPLVSFSPAVRSLSGCPCPSPLER